ncbi:serine/threonine-protein kinase [Actinomycetospora sp. OC33-EN08]|uniref:non-specific serine/threonine protein kinase n=1 Tax=Actinomycetospora aurantiaca TaxID=3129233 RepID=A0ABU8MIF1_9PSEU
MIDQLGPLTAPPGFTALRTLGRGGSGTVVEAHHASTGRTVALKTLDVVPADAEALRRFDRERGVMADLATHPGIVSIIDAGVHLGRPWIAMDLCRRGSMAGVGRLPADAVLTTLHAVADALSVAHARGVTHCDVKPANILVTDYGQAALGDFGVARLALGEGSGSTVGGYTLDHVAPEVIEGRHPTDRSDVFSLGTTAWQLLAGRPPFRHPGDAPAAVLTRLRTEPLPPLPADVPQALVDLLHRMTRKRPETRPSAGTVADEVSRLAQQHGVDLHRPLDEVVPTTTQVRLAQPHPSLPGTPRAGLPVGPAGLTGTDHRPDLARLTHAGAPVAVAAAAPALPAAAEASRRRDPVVIVAVVAAIVVVLTGVGVTTSALLPSSSPAQVVTSASGEMQVVPDLGIPGAPGVPAEPTLIAAASAPAAAAAAGGARPAARPGGAAPPVVPAAPVAPAGTTGGATGQTGGTPIGPTKAKTFVTPEMTPTLDCTSPNKAQCVVGPGGSGVSVSTFVSIEEPAGEPYPVCNETVTITAVETGAVVLQGSNGCNYRSPTYIPDEGRLAVGSSYKVTATARITDGGSDTATVYFEAVAG